VDSMFLDMQEQFEKEKFLVIRGFLTPEMCQILYKYCLIKEERTKFKIEHDNEKYDDEWDGEYNDPYVMNVYSSYGDPMMDGLLELGCHALSNCVGRQLLPNYSYWRLYTTGSKLDKHLDRESCEISVSLCVGQDISNLYSDYNWAFNFTNLEGKDTSICLNPGDLLVYKGCDLIHWREPFEGVNQAQVFMHYNDSLGPYKNVYDSRPILGIPSKFRKSS